MKTANVCLIGLLFVVSASAEPVLEGRVRLSSGQPAASVQVRLFDLTDLRRFVGATTDETGHFALPRQAFSTTRSTALPTDFALGQNYPNPFNPSTIIPYQLPAATHVRLEVFNLLGQRIATLVDAERAAGTHTAQWDGTDAAGRAVGAGVYIYQLSSDGMRVSRRMVLIDGQAGIPAAGAAGPMPIQASALERMEADAEVYGLTVAGEGLVAYVDPAFRVGVDEADIVVEEHSSSARMKLAVGGILGDVNNDGQVDAFDALYVLLYIEDNSIVLPNNGDISLGDLNEDGTVDFADAVLFVRYLADPSDPALPTGIGDDHGNTLSEATAVSLGSSTAGSLSEEDIDYFVIEISNDGTLLATTTGDTNTKGSILDSSGNVLASDSYSGTGINFMVAVPVSPGTYYIRVEGRFSWTTGDYTLEVRDNSPDLVVESPSVSPSSLSAGDRFVRIMLRVTVRNQGAGRAASTTLTWYRSDDATIDATDIVLDTDHVFRLDAAETSEESARMAAPEDAGTYYYGACVESVVGESNTDNNCSSAMTVTVEQDGDEGDGGGDDEGDGGGDDEGDDGEDGGSGTTYGVGEALPNYPSGFFAPAILSGASISISGGRTTLSFNNGGFVELQDGTRYTCIASGGCSIESGRVTAGTIRVTSGDEGDGGGDGGGDDGDGDSDDDGSGDDDDGAAVTGRITGCSATRDSFTNLVTVTISGTVQAHRSVSFLLVTGYANGSLVGIDSLDDMSVGQSQNFSISGIVSISGTRLTCTASMDYITSGSAKLTVGDPDSPEQVRVQGSLSPSSSLLNRKRSLGPLQGGE